MSVVYADDFTESSTGGWADPDERPGSAALVIPIRAPKVTVHASKRSAQDDSPLWLEPLVQALDRALRYAANEPGWEPADDATLRTAIQTVVRVLANDTIPPTVTPTPDGGLQFEWHDGGWDLEIEVLAGGDVDVWGASVDGLLEFSGALDEVAHEVTPVLTHLTARSHA